MTFDEQ